MRSLNAVLLCALLVPGLAFAKDDHKSCVEALDKLKSAQETDFTGTGHHEHQQAKQAHADGDYKKCADQASKALSHQKQG